jgi:hypothetical protein
MVPEVANYVSSDSVDPTIISGCGRNAKFFIDAT